MPLTTGRVLRSTISIFGLTSNPSIYYFGFKFSLVLHFFYGCDQTQLPPNLDWTARFVHFSVCGNNAGAPSAMVLSGLLDAIHLQTVHTAAELTTEANMVHRVLTDLGCVAFLVSTLRRMSILTRTPLADCVMAGPNPLFALSV